MRIGRAVCLLDFFSCLESVFWKLSLVVLASVSSYHRIDRPREFRKLCYDIMLSILGVIFICV